MVPPPVSQGGGAGPRGGEAGSEEEAATPFGGGRALGAAAGAAPELPPGPPGQGPRSAARGSARCRRPGVLPGVGLGYTARSGRPAASRAETCCAHAFHRRGGTAALRGGSEKCAARYTARYTAQCCHLQAAPQRSALGSVPAGGRGPRAQPAARARAPPPFPRLPLGPQRWQLPLCGGPHAKGCSVRGSFVVRRPWLCNCLRARLRCSKWEKFPWNICRHAENSERTTGSTAEPVS